MALRTLYWTNWKIDSSSFFGTVFSESRMKRILILMQLQDFKRIKVRDGMKNCFCFSLSWNNNWQLTVATGSCSVKKGGLRCGFAKKFEVLWIVQSRGTLTELGALRNSQRWYSVRKGALRNYAKFTGKHLCQTLFFNKVSALRSATLLKYGLWHRCFSVNFVKCLRPPFLQNTLGRLLLCSLKICLLAWDIDVFWSIILEDKLKAPWQNGRQN